MFGIQDFRFRLGFKDGIQVWDSVYIFICGILV